MEVVAYPLAVDHRALQMTTIRTWIFRTLIYLTMSSCELVLLVRRRMATIAKLPLFSHRAAT